MVLSQQRGVQWRVSNWISRSRVDSLSLPKLLQLSSSLLQDIDINGCFAYGSCEREGSAYYCASTCDASNGFPRLYASISGGGGVGCAVNEQDYRDCIYGCTKTYTQRPYCCDQPNPEQSWGACGRYDTVGVYSINVNPNLYCESDCSNGLTRVAMDNYKFANKNCSSMAVQLPTVATRRTLSLLKSRIPRFSNLRTLSPRS
jgi:hypothetical protein